MYSVFIFVLEYKTHKLKEKRKNWSNRTFHNFFLQTFRNILCYNTFLGTKSNILLVSIKTTLRKMEYVLRNSRIYHNVERILIHVPTEIFDG